MEISTISSCIKECLYFFKTNWVNLALLVPGAFFYTILHEGFHAIAVLVQGGRITHFKWIPTRAFWGYISFEFPPDKSYSNNQISLAPYIISSVIGGIVCIFGVFSSPLSQSASSTIFIWFFIVPVGDLFFASIPFVLFGSKNDFFDVFGAPTFNIRLLFICGGCFITIIGYLLQRRLYGSLALSICSYLYMVILAIILVLIVNYKQFFGRK